MLTSKKLLIISVLAILAGPAFAQSAEEGTTPAVAVSSTDSTPATTQDTTKPHAKTHKQHAHKAAPKARHQARAHKKHQHTAG